MENVFVAFCIMLQQGFGVPPQACNSTFTATYINSDVKKEVDESQRILTKKAWVVINDHRVIFYTLGAGAEAISVHNTQEFHVITPLTPYINQIGIDITNTERKVRIDWQWQF